MGLSAWVSGVSPMDRKITTNQGNNEKKQSIRRSVGSRNGVVTNVLPETMNTMSRIGED